MESYQRAMISGIAIGVIGGIITTLLTQNLVVGGLSFIAFIGAVMAIQPVVAWGRRFVSYRRTGIIEVFENQKAGEGAIQARMEHATAISILTIRGLGIFGLKDSLLRNHIIDRTPQASVRILLLDPDSKAVASRAAELKEDVASFMRGIHLAQEALQELQKRHEVKLEVRLYVEPPVWRVVMVDDVVFVSAFLAGKDGHKSALYEIQKGHEYSLYDAYHKEFEMMWTAARTFI